MTAARAMASEAACYEWKLITPLFDGADKSILAELSEFRGRILYANGRRPHFWRPGHGYADDDPLDANSFHITARADGELVGCMRIRALPEHHRTSVGRLMPASDFTALLKDMGVARDDCLEVGRWTVAPPARGTAVGRTLVVGAWAVGRWLAKRRLVVTVGTRDGQAIMLSRFGGRIFPSINVQYVPAYDDELAPMYFDLDQPPPRVADQLGSVNRLLQLQQSVTSKGKL